MLKKTKKKKTKTVGRCHDDIQQRQCGAWQDQDRPVEVGKYLHSNQRRASIFFILSQVATTHMKKMLYYFYGDTPVG